MTDLPPHLLVVDDDERIRAEKTDDFRDVANAVSLLTRLEMHA